MNVATTSICRSNLLAEQENSKTLQLLEQIANKLVS